MAAMSASPAATSSMERRWEPVSTARRKNRPWRECGTPPRHEPNGAEMGTGFDGTAEESPLARQRRHKPAQREVAREAVEGVVDGNPATEVLDGAGPACRRNDDGARIAGTGAARGVVTGGGEKGQGAVKGMGQWIAAGLSQQEGGGPPVLMQAQGAVQGLG